MVANLDYANTQRHQENIDRTAKAKVKHRLRLEIELAGIPQKALAIGAHLDEGQLSRMLNDKSEEALPAHKIPAVVQEVGPGFMEWLALQCGGIYTHGSEAVLLQGSLPTLVGNLAAQTGECVKQLITVMESHQVNVDTEKDVVAGLRQLALNIQTLLLHAEGRLG